MNKFNWPFLFYKIETWIKQQHSLPNFEVRTKPFFLGAADILTPRSPAPKAIRPGSLEVTVCSISRLDQSLQADGVFCILGTGISCWDN